MAAAGAAVYGSTDSTPGDRGKFQPLGNYDFKSVTLST